MLSALNRQTKRILVTNWGSNSQVWLGGFGIAIHETSHLLTALVFRHHIDSVRLIQFPSTGQPALGYVKHSWNPKSLYQRLGNFFIGLAPVVGCSLIIVALGYLLIPGPLNGLLRLINSPSKITSFSTSPLLSSPASSWWQILLFIVLTTNISCGGFDLSRADLQNAQVGAWLWAAILLITTTVLTFLSPNGGWFDWVSRLGIFWGILLGLALALSLATQIGIRLVAKLFSRV